LVLPHIANVQASDPVEISPGLEYLPAVQLPQLVVVVLQYLPAAHCPLEQSPDIVMLMNCNNNITTNISFIVNMFIMMMIVTLLLYLRTFI